jgi:hypothetical protein
MPTIKATLLLAFTIATFRDCLSQTLPAGAAYRPVPWVEYQAERDSAFGLAITGALPKIEADRWGFRFARMTLDGHAFLFIWARIAGGTGAGEEAFYLLEPTAGGRFRKTWAAMARYYQAPWGLSDVPTFRVKGCLLIGDDRMLRYGLVADTSAAAREFLAKHEEDYVPEEHLARRSGVYAIENGGNVRYVGPTDAQVLEECRRIPDR